MIPLFYYILSLSSLVYLHKYIYILGNNILLTFFKDDNIYNTIRRISDNNLINNNELNNINNDNNYSYLSEYKRKYVIKNIWKAFMLSIIMIGGTVQFIDGFFNNIWSNLSFKIWGTIYVSLDLSGLIYVRGLPTATVIHHIVVNILGLINSITDYNTDGYYRSMLIYTYFSILPFVVNFYLGYRYIDNNEVRKKKLAKIAYKVYFTSLSLNIISQILFFVISTYHHSIFFYIFLYCLIINDDIKLIKFLYCESK